MKRALGYGFLAVVLVLGGFGAGWAARGTGAQQDVAHLELLHGLDRTSRAANALYCVQTGAPERLPALLWSGVTEGLDDIERGLSGGARLESPAPNIAASLERVEEVANRSSKTTLAQRARAVRTKLFGTT